MTDIGELEKKAWFRFFKLCFVSVYVLSVCAVLFLSYDSLPSKYVDYWDIHCSDGRTAPTRENSIYPIDGQITPDEDSKARKLCEHQISAPSLPPGFVVEQMPPLPPGSNRETAARRNFIPDEKNYSLAPQYATRGSYKEAAKTFILGLGIVILLGEFIRRSFLYVVAGKPFFS